MEILSAGGDVIRTLESDGEKGIEGGGANASYALPGEKGINRAVWDLRRDSTPSLEYPFLFGAARDDDAVQGHKIAPGTYGVRLRLGDDVLESDLVVRWDPINTYDDAGIAEQQRMLQTIYPMITSLYRRINSLLAMQKQLELRKELAEGEGDEALSAEAGALLDALEHWQKSVTTPDRTTNQDVLNFAPKTDAFLVNLYQQVDTAVLGVTNGQRERFADLRTEWDEAIEAWNALMENEVDPFIERAGPAILVPAWE